MICRKKPQRVSGGIRIDKENNIWKWESVKWIKCKYCGFYHSNRKIPDIYWEREWKTNLKFREKVGIILIKNNKKMWITESYHNCYGFPKGEKEINETYIQCAKREFKEETGNDYIENLDLKKCLKIKTNIENIFYIFYVVHVSNNFELNEKPEDDVEITSFGWENINNVGKLKLSKAIRKIYNIYIRYLLNKNKKIKKQKQKNKYFNNFTNKNFNCNKQKF